MFPLVPVKPVSPLAESIDLTKKIIVFGHHPCPDGIASIICLAEILGMSNTFYCGLNHGDPDDMEKAILELIESRDPAHIIFADIIPPARILTKLLATTNISITLLDHHQSQIEMLKQNSDTLSDYINSTPPRLLTDLDVTRSGAAITYDYVYGKIERPNYISLIHAIDLLTATGNPEFIRLFEKNKIIIDSQTEKLFRSFELLSSNSLIKEHIEFYVIAALFDLQLKQFFIENKNQMTDKLIASMKTYFDWIKVNGLSALLKDDLSAEKTAYRNIDKLFRAQLEYQKHAIDNAVVIPSLIDDEMDVLFIEADIQTGRTFDPLIAQKLASFPRRTIAMIVNTKTISDTNNWVSLRAADDTFNLWEIASEYTTKGLGMSGGGHARASAIQLDRSQLSLFLDKAAQAKQMALSSHSFYLKCVTGVSAIAGAALLIANRYTSFISQRVGTHLAAVSFTVGAGLYAYSFFAKSTPPKSPSDLALTPDPAKYAK